MNHDVAKLIANYIDFSEFLKNENILKSNKIIVDLFFSNKCNLKCRHCYFGNTKNLHSPLTLNEWLKVTDSLYNVGISHFHISGKECSLEPQSVSLVKHIKSKVNTYCGVVTNGTGDSSYYAKLILAGIDYIEFSIDGLEYNHNYIRKNNTFTTTVESIKTIVEISSPETINLTTTLNSLNWFEYIDVVSYFYGIGVRRFFATPFLEKGAGANINNILISSDQLILLINNTLKFLENNKRKGIIIKYCIPHHLIMSLWNDSLYIQGILKKYFSGEHDLIFRINDNILQLSFSFIDLDYLNMLVITNDGYIIPCADDISRQNYPMFALGNISEISIEEIFNKRIESIKHQITHIINY